MMSVVTVAIRISTQKCHTHDPKCNIVATHARKNINFLIPYISIGTLISFIILLVNKEKFWHNYSYHNISISCQASQGQSETAK